MSVSPLRFELSARLNQNTRAAQLRSAIASEAYNPFSLPGASSAFPQNELIERHIALFPIALLAYKPKILRKAGTTPGDGLLVVNLGFEEGATAKRTLVALAPRL